MQVSSGKRVTGVAPDRLDDARSASEPRPDGDPVLLSRNAQLPPDPRSSSVARRLLREALTEADRTEWTDSAELALGEVVANAVLHAHTTFQIRLEVRPAWVHVEVEDANPTLPIPRDYEVEATTGRGLALVAALAQECGVRSLGQHGKVVWFDVGADTAASVEAERTRLGTWQAFGHSAPGTPDADADDCVEVRLSGLPPLLWLAARQHHDALMRELVLRAETHDVPGIDVVAADQARGTISESLALELERLRRTLTDDGSASFDYRGSQAWIPQRIDLDIRMSRRDGANFPALQDTLDTAERLATEGLLLVVPGLPEIVEVRDWACSQVVLQLGGVEATPWPGSAQLRFETTSHGASDAIEWDAKVVTESMRGVAAADDANRILAVSRPLAHALGWEVDDLVGRRVVTLIPPSLRETHVAAFTRHLATGDVHVLGQSLRLPVLRKDGTEVLSDFRVERGPLVRGRTVFLAWIEPLH